MRILLPTVLSVLFVFTAQAADKEKFGTLPEPPPPVKDYKAPPPPPADVQPDEAIPEPEVTITSKGEEQHEEYRIGGRLYMIKVTPKKGRPYYLIDPDGRGQFARSDFLPSVSPPMWVIKRW